MTVDEFLTWDSGDEVHYELIDGQPVAMAPAGAAHQALAGNIAPIVGMALQSRPGCLLRIGAGIVPAERSYTYFEADLAVSCDPSDVRHPYLERPCVLIEILSPWTHLHDRRVKLLSYQRIPSLEGILLVDARRIQVEVFSRAGEDWSQETLSSEQAMLKLPCIDLTTTVAEIYAGTPLSGSATR
jgi:Uma2 family endonuclease